MMAQIKKLQDLANMENQHALSLSTSTRGLKNLVIREILSGIAHDSRKHEGFYNAILSILKHESPAISEDDYDQLEKVIREHIDVEEKMIDQAKNLLNKEDDPRIKYLLTEIYNDESKHHILMTRILEAVIRREAIFEEDWWDAIWRDVPFHGSPGG